VNARNADPIAVSYAEMIKKLLGTRLKELWLFGSRARGDEREGSDYDVLVVADDDRKTVQAIMDDGNFRMLNENNELFTSIVYTPEIWEIAAASPLGLNIRQDGIRLA
jgi:predicted nucleotidyltransferase